VKVAAPVLEVKGELYINPHFGRTTLIGIANLKTGKIEVVQNPALRLEKRKGTRIAEFLLEKGVKALLVKDIGTGAFEKIRSRGIETYIVPKEVKKFREALELFRKGELQVLKSSPLKS
jgi:predicted Fe-Mo cluster-binding NifX family protein